MKTLLLMRHAKSSWDDPSVQDFDRPLNPRGNRDAPRMGQFLLQQDMSPDRVVTSTAVRAQATARFVAAECQLEHHITVVSDLYHAGVDDWQETVQSLSPEWNCVLCIGHNPGLEEFIGTLSSQYVRMPTAAIAHLTSRVDDWGDFADGTGVELQQVWRPKELA
ncbi:MAG: histidine phosphatase family protein [Planctomycetaceae bacterium]|nr:histidine phosphatase family protein [Planctomycetaceae bacterium]